MSYTRDDIRRAVEIEVGSMTEEQAKQFVFDELFHWFSDLADDDELRLFMEEGQL